MPVSSTTTRKTSWPTTLKCKFCYNNLKGYYSFVKDQTFFRCVCRGCSHWWVRIYTPSTDSDTEI